MMKIELSDVMRFELQKRPSNDTFPTPSIEDIRSKSSNNLDAVMSSILFSNSQFFTFYLGV